MWERTLAERSANSGANGSAGGGAAGGWSPRRSALPSAARFRGGGTHAGAEIPPRGHTQTKRHEPGRRTPPRCGRVGCSLAVPVPIPVPARVPGSSPPGSPDESSPTLNVSPDASSSSSVDQDEHAKASDRRVRFGSQMSVAEVNIDAQSNEPSFSSADIVPDDEIARVAVVASSRVVGRDGVVGHGESVREETHPDADAWRVGSVLHERLSLDGTPGRMGSAPRERTSSDGAPEENETRRRLRFSAA